MTSTLDTETSQVTDTAEPAADTNLRLVSWIWLGMVIGVSMIATPAKFNAESLDLAVALDVGRTTFGLFELIQWAVLVVIAGVVWRAKPTGRVDQRHFLILAAIAMVMVLQSLWLLPALNDRVAIVIAGNELPNSPVHLFFGVIEGAKILLLGLLGYLAPRRAQRT